jgi:transposase, IS6 family
LRHSVGLKSAKERRIASQSWLRTPVHYVTKHLQQGIESDHFRVKKNMPRIGGFQSFGTARRTIQGFEAMLWLRKGFGFAGAWTVREQNRLLIPGLGLADS